MRLRERLLDRGPGEPRLLVMTAVAAETEALQRGLGAAASWDGPVTILAGGVGPAAAAASTATALVRAIDRGSPYSMVISAGIGGGFTGRAAIGAIVLGTAAIAADLGAESPNGFLTLAELGFGQSTVESDGELVALLHEAIPEAVLGAVLTVSTVTGSADRAAALADRHPNAAAEGMEGFGVATAAAQSAAPFVELRTVSNPVGPRDRAAWRIADALASLERAGAVLASLMG